MVVLCATVTIVVAPVQAGKVRLRLKTLLLSTITNGAMPLDATFYAIAAGT